MSKEVKQELTKDDADKLGLPTSLEDIFSFGEEGKTIADVISMFIGGEAKDDLAILQRTNLSTKEASIVADALFLARFKLVDDGKPNGDWFIPELKDTIKWILRGRTSIDAKSIEKAVEALQSIKVKLEAQKIQTMSQI